jgi:1,4-alpha-glucan branching enzyme
MINLSEVGAHTNPAGGLTIHLGIYLPNITPAKGYILVVRIIHEKDQFTIEIPAKNFLLTFDETHPLGLWSATIDLAAHLDADGNFGTPGKYLYRYTLLQQTNNPSNPLTLTLSDPLQPQQHELTANVVTPFIPDPFATDTGIGKLSAFTVSNTPPSPFTWTDNNYKTPELDDLIVYELQVEEFASTFDGVVQRLDYLSGLGVNALELMPITTVPQIFDWGYGPLHFFAPEDRWGGLDGLKRLVDACHARGIAVIVDVVYQHVSDDFAYNRVYRDSGEVGPMGTFPYGPYGAQTTFHNMPFTLDYFRTSNAYWLNECHVDGLRYDNVAGYYDGATGEAYAALVYNTYQDSLPIARFQSVGGTSGYSRIIQCAEYLDNPPAILRDTYSNATWQDALLNKAEDMAQRRYVDDNFVHLLDPNYSGYPATRDFNGIQAPVAPFQYLNSHDHEYLIDSFGKAPGIGGLGDVEFGIRANVAKLQPFAIALYTCQGIPMLWQGEEIVENYTLPSGGNARISFRRSMHWEYFYDQYGQELVRLYRILGRLRRNTRALRSRQSFYFNQQSNTSTGIVAYQRHAPATATEPEQYALIYLNFSDTPQSIAIPFPKAGTYREMIDDGVRTPSHLDITVTRDGDVVPLPQPVPSNYGYIFVSIP